VLLAFTLLLVLMFLPAGGSGSVVKRGLPGWAKLLLILAVPVALALMFFVSTALWGTY
jgi:hypothetical protein